MRKIEPTRAGHEAPGWQQLALDWCEPPMAARSTVSVQYLGAGHDPASAVGLMIWLADDSQIVLRWQRPVRPDGRTPIAFLDAIASEPMTLEIGTACRVTASLALIIATAAQWRVHRIGHLQIGGVDLDAALCATAKSPGSTPTLWHSSVADMLLDALCGRRMNRVLDTLADSGLFIEHAEGLDWRKLSAADAFCSRWPGSAALMAPMLMQRGDPPAFGRALLGMLEVLPKPIVRSIAHRMIAHRREVSEWFLYFLATYLRQYLRRPKAFRGSAAREAGRLRLLTALAERRALIDLAPRVIEKRDAATLDLMPGRLPAGRLRPTKACMAGASKLALVAWSDAVLARLLEAELDADAEADPDPQGEIDSAILDSGLVLDLVIEGSVSLRRLRNEPLWFLAEEAEDLAGSGSWDDIPQSWPGVVTARPEAVTELLRSAGLSVEELCTYEALCAEGEALGHCVGNPRYAYQAGRGELRIFSIRSSKPDGLRATLSLARGPTGWERSELSDGSEVDLLNDLQLREKHSIALSAVGHFIEWVAVADA